jgi:ligand-binding sensor domain-containing protein
MKTQLNQYCREHNLPAVRDYWVPSVGLGVPKVPARTSAARFLGVGAPVLGLLLCASVMAQPVITQHPVDRTVAVRGTALFQVLATGTAPLSYQWQFNDTDLEGATQLSLRITNAQPNHAGRFTAVVTDVSGSTTSQPAVLTVDREWVMYNRGNSDLPYDGVVDLEVDRDGDIWIATGLWNGSGGGGLAKFNGTAWTVYRSGSSPLPANDCTGLTLDAAGNLWVSTEAGVARFDRTNHWDVVSRSQLWFPKVDLDGNLWIGSSSGLWVYDGISWKSYRRANSGLPSDFAAFVSVDAGNRKWISTHGGLAVLDGQTWTTYTLTNSGLPNNTVAPVAFDAAGTAWIATYGGGLARFDGQQWTVFNPTNSGLPHVNLEDIVIDPTGVKWIATDGGLAQFDGTNWKTRNRVNSRLPDNVIQALALDGYGNLWLGMKDGGLAVFREGGVIPRLQIESLLPDGQGRLTLRWTGGKGPYRVQTRAGLETGRWEDAGDPTEQQSLAIAVEPGSRFFRVSGTQP